MNFKIRSLPGALLLICVPVVWGGSVLAEEAKKNQAPKLRPTSTLSSAADAAQAAAVAASAASNAAASAAAAAAAAVNAINAILPPSQRIPVSPGTPALTPAPAQANDSTLPGTPAATLNASPDSDPAATPEPVLAMPEPVTPPQDIVKNFAMPQERSLIGLVGQPEIGVSADAGGEYAAGIAPTQALGGSPVSRVGGIDLAQSVAASLGFSRDVLVANARIDLARAQTGQARAFMLPSLLLNFKTGNEISRPGAETDPATGTRENRSNHTRTDRSLTLRQPILDVSSLYDWKRREVLEKSREELKRASEGDTYLATVNAYLALASSRIQADMAQDYENQLQQLFQYVDKRAGAGASSNSDKERVRARSLSARSSRLEQEAAHAAAGTEFVRLVNLAPSSLRLPELEDLGVSIVPPNVELAMPLAIAANPEIASLEAEYRATEIDQTVAKGRFFPRFDLELSDNLSVNPGGQDISQRDRRMMVVMNLPIFNGGGDLKFYEEKVARSVEIKYRLDDQRRRVLQSLTAQYATLEATRDRITAGYRELESISKAADAMSLRMVSGNQSLLDMLDVYDRYFQARIKLVNLHVVEMSAVAQIARLIQGLPRQDAPGVPLAAADVGPVAMPAEDIPPPMEGEKALSGLAADNGEPPASVSDKY